jgi:hypothetical protein
VFLLAACFHGALCLCCFAAFACTTCTGFVAIGTAYIIDVAAYIIDDITVTTATGTAYIIDDITVATATGTAYIIDDITVATATGTAYIIDDITVATATGTAYIIDDDGNSANGTAYIIDDDGRKAGIAAATATAYIIGRVGRKAGNLEPVFVELGSFWVKMNCLHDCGRFMQVTKRGRWSFTCQMQCSLDWRVLVHVP